MLVNSLFLLEWFLSAPWFVTVDTKLIRIRTLVLCELNIIEKAIDEWNLKQAHCIY